MDGLLINSEDIYTDVTNTILREHGRPDIPWSVKAKLQGRPGPEAGRLFHQWAQLPMSDDEFSTRNSELQMEQFKHCKPLPGVARLLQNLSRATSGPLERKVHMAVATSSHAKMFRVKTSSDEAKLLFSRDIFSPEHVVCGDDPRVPKGRGKPLPDIYLTALKTINQTIEASGSGEPPVRPEECLVFEDAVPGCEAGRRAGCRVVWCPHEGLLAEYRGREKEVLAGATGEHRQEHLEHAGASEFEASPGHVGEVDDGWGELLLSLGDFDYEKYGIRVPALLN
ncbi:hypothetical protein ED733_002396 [Metarhizium rileyi]|uniref:HAD-like domain protein n=1 Tax=Metarhizium rileyi (strain RCEF 4871) TaxID=1649241 RepID=A0A5C6G7I3_METRR|nr:hypothetical protein ED733_002396 [Metarhizium rileyi]